MILWPSEACTGRSIVSWDQKPQDTLLRDDQGHIVRLGELQMVLASSTVANTPTHSFPLTGFAKELEDVYKDATGCISFSEKTSSRKRGE